jgi:hypothetical protein
MLKRHKDLLCTIVASLRLTLAGAGAVDGSGQRGDLKSFAELHGGPTACSAPAPSRAWPILGSTVLRT